jgi:hypothetical protein
MKIVKEQLGLSCYHSLKNIWGKTKNSNNSYQKICKTFYLKIMKICKKKANIHLKQIILKACTIPELE